MTHEPFDARSTIDLITAALRDFSGLMRKELELARAELTEKAMAAVRASVLVAIAGFCGAIATMLIAWGVVYAIAATGLALYWSCFIVAAGLAVVAGALVLLARSRGGALVPHRTVGQIREDVRVAKEHLR